MNFLLALLTLLFGSGHQVAATIPVASISITSAPAVAPILAQHHAVVVATPSKATPAPGIRTVNNENCPAANVQQIGILSDDGVTANNYPICYQPPTGNEVWVCTHYLPDGQWTVELLAVPTTMGCGSDGLGDAGKATPGSVT